VSTQCAALDSNSNGSHQFTGLPEMVRAASLVMAEIEFPDFRITSANCSSDSLRRLRRTLTCNLSLKSNEFRK
jgi:hypothetical protein